MASTQGFNYTRKRKQADPSNRPEAPDVAVTLTVSSTKLRVTCPIPMSVTGLPQIAATGGAHTGTAYPTAVSVVSPTVFDLTYAASVATGNVITIGSKLPGFRGYNGCYVQPQTKTLS